MAYIYGKFDEFRAIIRTNLKPSDELTYGSRRLVDIERSVFARYIRENIAAKVLRKEAKSHFASSKKAKDLFL